MGWQNERDWHNDRTFEAYITQEQIDKQGDKISIGAFKKIMPWVTKYGVIHYKHSNLNFGEPLAWKVEGDRIKIKVGVHDNWKGHFPVFDEVWEEVKQWNNQGYMSIGGQSVIDKINCDDKKCWNDIEKLGVFEISWVGAHPANPGAQVDKVNTLAKGEIATVKFFDKDGNELLQKPFGHWKNWDACMADMRKRYDEETAEKVCGALKVELEKEVVERNMGNEEGMKKEEEMKKEQGTTPADAGNAGTEGVEKQGEVPDEGNPMMDMLKQIYELLLQMAKGGGETPPEEKSTEQTPTASERPGEVSVKIKELEKQIAEMPSVIEKTVQGILEKHKITVKATEKPAQVEGKSGSPESFGKLLEKARDAANLSEFRGEE